MRIKQIAALLTAVLMLVSLTACSNGGDDSSSGSETENRLVIYHDSEELTVPLTNLVKAYNAAANRSVGVKLAGDGYMNEAKNEKAALYIVDSEDDLSGWFGGGMFENLSEDTALSGAFGSVPAGLQLNESGLGSYGIPLGLYGCGYIFDYGLLEDLFGEDSADSLAEDLSVCSYTDFEGFVEAVSTYISAPSAAKVTVNGNEYTFAAEKSGAAKNLTGVFSLSYDSTSAEEALLSYALAAKYSNAYEVMSVTGEELSPDDEIFSAYTETLDMHTSHIAGKDGGATRGEAFAGGEFDYTGAVDLFAHNYALFYPGSTDDAADFAQSVEGYDSRLGIIPMKLPIDDGQVTAGGISAEKLQSSIVIGSRYYLAINPEADDARLAEARDFIKWLYTAEAGKTAFSGAFGGFAFNSSSGTNGNASSGASSAESTGSASENGTGSSIAGSSANGTGSSAAGSSANGTGSSANGAGSSADSGSSAVAAPKVAGRNAMENSGTLQSGGIGTTGSGSSAGSDISGSAGSSAAESNSVISGEGSGIAEGPAVNYAVPASLMAAVAEYYEEGRWLPMLSRALPEGWIEDTLAPNLRDYFGMETWSDSDRTEFSGALIGGWSDMLGGNDESEGENSLGDMDGDGMVNDDVSGGSDGSSLTGSVSSAS